MLKILFRCKQHRLLYRTMTGKVEIPKDGVWYSDALKWAKKLDLLKGTYSVEFDVNADAPRANIVVYLFRYFEK